MINKSSIPRSHSSHGGTLYYVYEIPKDEYYYSRKVTKPSEQRATTPSVVNKR